MAKAATSYYVEWQQIFFKYFSATSGGCVELHGVWNSGVFQYEEEGDFYKWS